MKFTSANGTKRFNYLTICSSLPPLPFSVIDLPLMIALDSGFQYFSLFSKLPAQKRLSGVYRHPKSLINYLFHFQKTKIASAIDFPKIDSEILMLLHLFQLVIPISASYTKKHRTDDPCVLRSSGFI